MHTAEMTEKVITTTKDKLNELLESLQNMTASLYQYAAEAAAKSTLPADSQEAIQKFKAQAAQLLTAVEQKATALVTQLQDVAVEGEFRIKDVTEEVKRKVREAIAIVRQSDVVLADLANTCRASLRSLHATSTGMSTQFRLDDHRRQAREELQRVIEWSLDKAQGVQERVKEATQRACEAAEKGRQKAHSRASKGLQMYNQRIHPRVTEAADQLAALSPAAHQKVQEAFVELKAEGSTVTRVFGAFVLTTRALILFFCAVVAALCGKIHSKAAEGAGPSLSHAPESDSSLARLEIFIVDKLQPAGDHIRKVSPEATRKVAQAYAELHAEKPMVSKLLGASLEMGRAVVLVGCAIVSTLCSRVTNHVEDEAVAASRDSPLPPPPADKPEEEEEHNVAAGAPSNTGVASAKVASPKQPKAERARNTASRAETRKPTGKGKRKH